MMFVRAGAAPSEGTMSGEKVGAPRCRVLLQQAVPHGHHPPCQPARLMFNWWPLRGFQKINERRQTLVSELKLATPSAYFRVGKLGVVPGVSLGQQKKEGIGPGQG